MMTRKEFLGTVLKGTAATAYAGVVLSGCGSDSPSAPDAAGIGNCLANGTSVSIGTNHGHSLTVSKADVAAAAAKTYDIMGTAIHTHSLTLTAADFQMLEANQTITVTSTAGGSDGHTHVVRVLCA